MLVTECFFTCFTIKQMFQNGAVTSMQLFRDPAEPHIAPYVTRKLSAGKYLFLKPAREKFKPDIKTR